MINLNEDGKTYYIPGDIVTLKHSQLKNVPVMYVVEKVTKTILNRSEDSKENAFVGIKCRWFDNNSCLQEAIFSTKDLIHV